MVLSWARAATRRLGGQARHGMQRRDGRDANGEGRNLRRPFALAEGTRCPLQQE